MCIIPLGSPFGDRIAFVLPLVATSSTRTELRLLFEPGHRSFTRPTRAVQVVVMLISIFA